MVPGEQSIMTRKSRCTVRKQREMNAAARHFFLFLYPSSGNGATNITVGLPPQLPQSRKSLSDTPEIYLCDDSKGYQFAIEINYHTVSCGKRGRADIHLSNIFICKL